MGRLKITPVSMVIVDNYVLHRDEPTGYGDDETTSLLKTFIHRCLVAAGRIFGRKRGYYE